MGSIEQDAASLRAAYDEGLAEASAGGFSSVVKPNLAQQQREVTAELHSIREYFRVNHEAFIRLVLAEELTADDRVPEFHIAGFRVMISDNPDHAKSAIAWPRDHAKTTLAKVATVYRLVYGLSNFPLYLSNTSPVASAATRDIVDFLTNPRIEQIYGRVVLTTNIRANGQFEGHLMELDGTIRHKFIIASLGAGQQVRGTNRGNKRPDFLIVDDLESAEEGERNKLGYGPLKTWFYGTLRKALATGKSKIVQIGNYVTAKSILGDHIASPYWFSIKLSAFNAAGQPLWPERWSMEALRLDFLEYLEAKQMHTWLAEMLNLPFGDSVVGVKPENVVLAQPISPGDPRILLRCITVDPAISSNMQRADNSVICVHVLVKPEGVSSVDGRDLAPYWQLAAKSSAKGRGPYKLYADIIQLALHWRVAAIGIEDEGYQAALLAIAETEAARSGFTGLKFIPLKTMKKSKASRIIAWAEALNAGLYRLSNRDVDVLTQLFNYDIHSDNNTDDEIDCCSYILQMIKLHTGAMAAALNVNQDETRGELVPAALAGRLLP